MTFDQVDVGCRITYRVRDYGEGATREGTVVRLGHNPKFLKVRCDDSTYLQTIRVADVVAVEAPA